MFTHQFNGERLLCTTLHFELADEGEGVDFVVSYARSDCNGDAQLRNWFLANVGGLGATDPNENVLLVLMVC